MRPSIGVGLPLGSDADGVAAASRAAGDIEQSGVDVVSLADVLTGDGSPTVDCLTMSAVVAAVTERVRIEFGVLVASLRPVVTLATQLLTLQHVSGGRVILGVGAGGFPGSPFWTAAHAPSAHRGDRLEEILDVLPPLLAGRATTVDGAEAVVLAPSARLPPVLVGGHSAAAMRRSVTHGDGWFPSLMAPDTLARRVRRLRELAAEHGRPTPLVHFGTHAALGPDADAQAAALASELASDMGIAADDAVTIPITGSAARVADRIAAYAESGADSITLTLDGAAWRHQLDVVAEARQLLQ